MTIQNTYLTIPGLLTKEQIQQIDAFSSRAKFEDGKKTASAAAREVKNNLQMDMQCPEYGMVQQVLLQALNANMQFRNAVLLKTIYPFLISTYREGMTYGWHVDSPLMANMMRTDIAMTIFLNNPEEYEGGELELQTASGTVLYKLAAGDAVCYPCTQLHQVREVVSGERKVAVTWIQSMVKSADQRKVLSDIQEVIDELRRQDMVSEPANVLQQTHSNLIRMWAE